MAWDAWNDEFVESKSNIVKQVAGTGAVKKKPQIANELKSKPAPWLANNSWKGPVEVKKEPDEGDWPTLSASREERPSKPKIMEQIKVENAPLPVPKVPNLFPEQRETLSYCAALSGRSKVPGVISLPLASFSEVIDEQKPFEANQENSDPPKKRKPNKPSKNIVLAQFITEPKAVKKPPSSTSVVAIQNSKMNAAKSTTGNLLDGSVPVFHKGKTRENGKKKLSTTKKIILREKEARKEEPKPEAPANPPPHSRHFRTYSQNMPSKELDEAVVNFVQQLMKFQDRVYQKDPNKAKLKRRFVCGMREVGKMLSVEKVKCVLMAPDIEASGAEGGLDEQVQRIIDWAAEKALPVIFALSKRKLAASLQKHMNVSCVGIINYQGADEQYKAVLGAWERAKADYERKISSRSRMEAAVNAEPFVPSNTPTSSLSSEMESLSVTPQLEEMWFPPPTFFYPPTFSQPPPRLLL